jgi:hypothetical protein
MDSESIADRQPQGHPAKSTDAPRGDNVNVIVDTCSSITLSRDDQDEDEKKHGILGVNEQGQYDSIADLESDGDDGDQVKVIRYRMCFIIFFICFKLADDYMVAVLLCSLGC